MEMHLLPKELQVCRKCERLAAHREAVANKEVMRRKAYEDYQYWGKPVPGFGDIDARILLLGLAPGAHGANRVGRMFSGDASADFLFAALYKQGLANQAESNDPDDGLELNKLWITSAARCVPPSNKLLRSEMLNCQTWLRYDISHLKNVSLVLALGATAHNAYLEYLKSSGQKIVKSNYPFGHDRLHSFEKGFAMLDSYHVSFQNTNTGRLTAAMFEKTLQIALDYVKKH